MSQEHRPLPPQEQHEPTREERTLTSHDIITHPDARWYHFFPYFGLTIKETIQSLLPYSPLRRENVARESSDQRQDHPQPLEQFPKLL